MLWPDFRIPVWSIPVLAGQIRIRFKVDQVRGPQCIYSYVQYNEQGSTVHIFDKKYPFPPTQEVGGDTSRWHSGGGDIRKINRKMWKKKNEREKINGDRRLR
jgi:hypothetical protein